MVKLVAGADGRKLRGGQIAGEGACDLIHVCQMALLGGWEVDVFVENVFDFPTLAELARAA